MVASVFRTEWPKLVAILVRDFGDLELAEDCAQDAFVQASQKWDVDMAVPDNPGAWLTTTARRRAIDIMRRSSSYKDKLAELGVQAKRGPEPPGGSDLIDEQLALLLGCCHPALGLEAQVALTLRLVGGLTTDQIARAFLVEEATMSKRLTRAKHKVRAAGIRFGAVDRGVLEERVSAVRHVVYLIFNEGHSSASDAEFVRGDLCDEAIWLSALVSKLLPEDSEAHGLHALILFTDARRATRVDDEGAPILLEDQNRYLWDRDKIAEGLKALGRARDNGTLGSFGLQAILASMHAVAPSFEETDWLGMVRIYDVLAQVDTNAVVLLNRAVAVSYAVDAEAGLQAMDPLRDHLDHYVYLHSARAALLQQLDRNHEAVAAYERALSCGPPDAQRVFLEGRIALLTKSL